MQSQTYTSSIRFKQGYPFQLLKWVYFFGLKGLKCRRASTVQQFFLETCNRNFQAAQYKAKAMVFLIRMDIIYCMINEEFVMREHMFYNVL
ncbi:hypothetical protein AM232_09820 [Bacillus sp. FJAT-21352]|nr:hypothetical protein DOZ91_04460 [Peribacillus frigoritolerans]KOR78730.1 hypothetical protein AM232_09820 [Bacillus sp. FJAT-21352]